LAPGQLGVWSIAAERWLHRTTIDYHVGTMRPCGELVVALCGRLAVARPDCIAVIHLPE